MSPFSSFPLMKGVHFGDDMSTIKHIEGRTPKFIARDGLVYEIVESGTPCGEIIYRFDDGLLKHMGFATRCVNPLCPFSGETEHKKIEMKILNSFSAHEKEFTARYGNPHYNMINLGHSFGKQTCGDKYIELVNTAIHFDSAYMNKNWTEDSEFRTLGWLKPSGEDCVVIHITQSNITLQEKEGCYPEQELYLDWGYTFIPSKQYKELLQKGEDYALVNQFSGLRKK